MENAKTTAPTALHYTKIAFIVLLACLTLFFIDEGSPDNSGLFNLGNLMGLLIYFIPTFALSILLFRYFSRKLYKSDSIFLSLLISIPICFFLVIFLFVTLVP